MNIAIFGGAFNPPHKGHEQIVKSLLNDYDKVILVPTYSSLCKKNETPFSDIVNMLNILFKENDNISISLIEEHLKSSYTFDVIKAFIDVYNLDKLTLIIGRDQDLNFNNWYKHEEIKAMVNIDVFNRPGYDTLSDKSIITMDVSSSQIRNAVSNNLSEYLDEKIIEYITENKLYGGNNE